MTAEDEAGAQGGRGPERERRGSLLGWLKARLSRTRGNLLSSLGAVLAGRKALDEELLEELEEVLITADLGVGATGKLLSRIREGMESKELNEPRRVREAMKRHLSDILQPVEGRLVEVSQKPLVIMVVGVNGTGKTTTIGKLAHRYRRAGRSVILAAGDTFRAAAVDQLAIWAERAGAEMISAKSGADPSAVVYDAVQAAKARGHDVVIADTAGRLHTKVNLMEELKKMRRVMGRTVEGSPHEVLLVLDATTGQNAISQATIFQQGLGVTGIAMAKLDGTAKGGILVAIADQLGIPIKLLGLGERIDDLRDFDARQFVEALMEE